MRSQDKKAILTKAINRHIFKGTIIKQIKLNDVVMRIVPRSTYVLFSNKGYFDRVSPKGISDYIVRNNLYDAFVEKFK